MNEKNENTGQAVSTVAGEVGLTVIGALEPTAGLVVEIVGKLATPLGGPDLARTEIGTLQSDIVRLYRMIEDRKEEITSKVNPVEAFEIATQTVADTARTIAAEKRKRLANVLIHGLCDADLVRSEREHLLRAARELEDAHVELLRATVASVSEESLPKRPPKRVRIGRIKDGEHHVHALVALGLVGADTKIDTSFEKQERGASTSDAMGVVSAAETRYYLTKLGWRFVDFLKDP